MLLPMQFTADVTSGSGRGKGLRCPTLNLERTAVPDDLPEGVYACFARLGSGGIRLPATMHYGPRPTFGDTPSCEVHIIDHAVSIPPRTLTVDVVEKLRDIRDFGSAEALAAQMELDITETRKLLCVPC